MTDAAITDAAVSSSTPLAALRAALADLGVDGFMVPRTDAFQGEYVPACDERLAWLTGFTGSAGLLIALRDRAALFVDGRYELQAPQQVAGRGIEVVAIRKTKPTDWLAKALGPGAALAYDPWLHTTAEVERLAAAAVKAGASLQPLGENPVDGIWADRPSPPAAPAVPHPLAYAGESAAGKRARLAETLTADGVDAALIGAPESVCWLFNIRGADVPCTPVIRARALLGADGAATLFVEPEKIDDHTRAHLGDGVTLAPPSALAGALSAYGGRRVALDKAGAPRALADLVDAAGAKTVWRADPVAGPKARKNPAEIAGARTAQRRDGAALAMALAWIERETPSAQLTELDVATKLTEIRTEAGQRLGMPLMDLSFDAITGFGPNGAIVHYRVDASSALPLDRDGVLLIDSGGQYRDATTDVTRTIAIGTPPEPAKRAFTLVLKGMIAVSRLRFPEKTAGREIEAFARAALWAEGLDFDHGVGHGVGSYLSVHEGPASLSRRSAVALEAGMILSNEPGYYRAGAFGIRIENLVLVSPAETPEGGERPMHSFETLTLAPIDRRMIQADLLDSAERSWLNRYHARVAEALSPLVDDAAARWLTRACAPI